MNGATFVVRTASFIIVVVVENTTCTLISNPYRIVVGFLLRSYEDLTGEKILTEIHTLSFVRNCTVFLTKILAVVDLHKNPVRSQ